MNNINLYTFSVKNGVNELDEVASGLFHEIMGDPNNEKGIYDILYFNPETSISLDKKSEKVYEQVNIAIGVKPMGAYRFPPNDDISKYTKHYRYIVQLNFYDATDLYLFENSYDLCVFLKPFKNINFIF